MTSARADRAPVTRGPFGRSPGAPFDVETVRRLADALHAVGTATTEDLLDVVARSALELVGGDTAVVGTVDLDGAVARAVVGDPQVGPAVGARLPLEHSLLGIVARTGRAELCVDGLADARTDLERNRRLSIGSSAVAPLTIDEVVVGTVTLLARRTARFDELDLELLTCLSTAAAARLHHVRWAADESELRRSVLETLEEGVLVTRGHRHEVVLRNGVAAALLGLPDVLPDPIPLERMAARLVRPDGSACRFVDLPPVRAGNLAHPVVGEVYRVAVPGVGSVPEGGQPDGPWVRISSVPTVDPLSGTATSVVTRILDVTGERRTQRTADAGRERLRAAQAIVGLAWWEFDAVVERWSLSPELFEMLGLDPSSPDVSFGELMALVHADDVSDEPADGMSANGARLFRIRTPDGDQRVIQVWSERDVAPDGLLLRIHGVTLDVTERERVLGALAVREDQFRLAFDESPLGMTMYDLDAGVMLRANAAWVRMLGYAHESDVLGLTVGELVAPDEVELETERVSDFVDGTTGSRQSLQRFVHRDGHLLTVLVSSSVTGDGSGGRTLLSHMLDVSEQRRAEIELAASERLFRGAFDDAPWGMALLSAPPGGAGIVVRANQALADILQRPLGELVGIVAQDVMPPDERQTSRSTLEQVASSGVPSGRQQRRFVRPDGSVVHAWVSSTRVTAGGATHDGHPAVLTHVVDVTSQREHQRVLERMAMTDPVTGLANRSKLAARLDRALAAGRAVALLLLDLDRFKNVNDSLGHQAGDLMLVEVSDRLRALVQPGWTVARLGGDEFVVMAEDVGDPAEVLWVTESLLAELARPYDLDGVHRVTSSASVGVAFAPASDVSEGGSSSEDLLRQADMALYAAKDAGRNRYVVCDEALLGAAWSRMETEVRLRSALAEGRLRLHLQPILDLDTGRLHGLEALVRLDDPELGLLGPQRFIDVAEETELIIELDAWVLSECVALVAHDRRFLEDDELHLSVNISSRSLTRPAFPVHLRRCLERHGVPGRRLLIEITESSLMDDDPVVRGALAEIRATGALLGIDDFGTGYSALAYLQRFELDVLKIDKSFVSRLREPGDRAAATVAAIIDLAHAHELVVIAEGVESGEQADLLREMRCDLGQGWLFGHPRP